MCLLKIYFLSRGSEVDKSAYIGVKRRSRDLLLAQLHKFGILAVCFFKSLMMLNSTSRTMMIKNPALLPLDMLIGSLMMRKWNFWKKRRESLMENIQSGFGKVSLIT